MVIARDPERRAYRRFTRMGADQEEAKPLPLIDTDNTDRKLGDLVIGHGKSEGQ